MCKEITFLLILSFGIRAYSQEETVYPIEGSEQFLFDYKLYPLGNDDIHLAETNFKLNLPSSLGKFTLKNSLGLNYSQITYGSFYHFDTSNLRAFYDLSYGLHMDYTISNQWMIGGLIGASLSSNTRGKISTEDLFYNGGISGTYKFNASKDAATFQFGVGYFTYLGKPQWLPFLLFSQQVNEEISLGIGFPKSGVNYELNERNSFDFSLEWSGLTAYLRNPTYVDATAMASKVQFKETALGLTYTYKLSSLWSFYFGVGYRFTNDYLMLDDRNNTVYDFQTQPKPYFSSGIKFNINNN